MNIIFRHIQSLLLTHECVIVPGIGGFLTHEAPAFYDEEEKAFLPPSRSIGFNPELTLNDGTLTRSYMEANQCSYHQASKKMQKDIQAMSEVLRREKQYTLDGIGTLCIGKDGRYTFRPLESGALTPGLFGLSRYEMKPLSGGSSTADVITIKVSTVRRVASVAAAIVALCVLAIPVVNGGSSKSDDATLRAESPLSALTDHSSNASKSASWLTALSNLRQQQAQQSQTPAQVAQDCFTIVLACDVAEDNCKIYADMIRQNGGIDTELLQVGNNYIYYGNYATHEAAGAALRLMQDNKYFKIGWVKELTKQ